MDWLIFCTITPRFLVIPDTEGNPGYKNYKFHLNGLVGKGLIYAMILSVFIDTITFLMLKLLNL